MNKLTVEFCGETTEVAPGQEFVVGREGDLVVDDNPYMHRRFLVLTHLHGFWWLVNEGSRIAATVSSGTDGTQAWLPAGARIPLVFGYTTVVFTAGPVTYEFAVHADAPVFTGSAEPTADSDVADETIGELPLTPSQKVLIVALAEPLLLRDGTGTSRIPSSAATAARLGWSMSKFNRKLDNVCEKYDRIGISGLRSSGGEAAMGRKARLVEYALAARIVTRADLPMIDEQKDEPCT